MKNAIVAAITVVVMLSGSSAMAEDFSGTVECIGNTTVLLVGLDGKAKTIAKEALPNAKEGMVLDAAGYEDAKAKSRILKSIEKSRAKLKALSSAKVSMK